MFMFIMCFQCVNGFIYSILYTPVTMYYVLQLQPRANSELSAKSHLKWWAILMVLPLMFDAHGQSPHVVTLGWAVPFIAAVRTAERVLQHRMTLLFHFLVEQGNFLYDFHWGKNNVNVRDIEVFGISVTSATSTVILLFMPVCCINQPPTHLGYQLTFNPPSAKTDCWQGPIRTRSPHITLPSTLIPNHVLLNYSNGANPMHFSLCNMYSCLWCSSAICRENPVIAIQY